MTGLVVDLFAGGGKAMKWRGKSVDLAKWNPQMLFAIELWLAREDPLACPWFHYDSDRHYPGSSEGICWRCETMFPGSDGCPCGHYSQRWVRREARRFVAAVRQAQEVA